MTRYRHLRQNAMDFGPVRKPAITINKWWWTAIVGVCIATKTLIIPITMWVVLKIWNRNRSSSC